ncbi:MAG: P-II family nitrogen regulator [Bacteroidota bacterium]
MKELRALIRISHVGKVVKALRNEGFSFFTCDDVFALGGLIDPENWRVSLEHKAMYSRMCIIDLLCRTEDVDKVVTVIRSNGCTHQQGDGIIVLSSADRIINIRTGHEEEYMLHS